LTAKDAKNAKIEIYNLKGQKVKTLPVSPSQSHTVSVTWNGDDQTGNPVSSGIYFYKLNMENSPIKKMMLLK
nr:FlgD immunoglobulin-like domain containing protein [Candidatus Cloacimonadota bacterium]